MRYGTVVQFFEDKGFGFIRPDVGQDVFFHVSSLGACQTLPKINAGQAVKFELEPKKQLTEEERENAPPRDSKAKPPQRRAKIVELIDRLPGGVLENDNRMQLPRHPNSKRRKASWKQ